MEIRAEVVESESIVFKGKLMWTVILYVNKLHKDNIVFDNKEEAEEIAKRINLKNEIGEAVNDICYDCEGKKDETKRIVKLIDEMIKEKEVRVKYGEEENIGNSYVVVAFEELKSRITGGKEKWAKK